MKKITRSLAAAMRRKGLQSRASHYAVIALAASLFAVGGSILAGQQAAAETDLSGTWSASYALTCAATFTQSGSDLSADVDCGGDIAGTLTGTIDPVTGDFTLDGFFSLVPIDIQGTVSSDGTSMSGSLTVPVLVPSGAFSAVPDGTPIGGTDPTGDWSITVTGVFAGNCVAAFVQSGTDLSATMECDGGLTGMFVGTFDTSTDAMALSGPVTNFVELVMDGTVSSDRNSISGTWTLAPLGTSGSFSATRQEEAPAPAPTATVSALPSAGAALDASGGGTTFGGLVAASALAAAGVLALSGAAWYARGRWEG